MKTKIIMLLLWLLPLHCIAQYYPLSVSIFSNATNLPTKPAAIFTPLHPGISIGTAFRYNKNSTHKIGQTAKLSFFHHRFMHSQLMAYTEFTYKNVLKNGLDFGPAAGIGYVHSFTAPPVFKLNSNGNYERQPNWGRPQFMATTALEAGYTFRKSDRQPPRLFITYQFWLQAPFINQYVTVLPNTSLHLGLSYPLFRDKKYSYNQVTTPDI